MTIETAAGTEALNYAYDSNGNILSLSLRGSEATAAISETRYAYDSLNRLISWYDSLADTTTTTTYSYVNAGPKFPIIAGRKFPSLAKKECGPILGRKSASLEPL